MVKGKIITKVGDVFVVKIDDKYKCYFQYISNDLTQLNSDVIKVFSKKYFNKENPNLNEIVNDEPLFYAHCVTKWGVKLGYWEKIGNTQVVDDLKILFRTSGDVGDMKIKKSDKWWVWKINEDFQFVGALKGDFQKAEIGSIVPPDSIVYRIMYSKYDFVYPEY